mgnify:CR=1 FL=1|tara:strand:- start:105 stop:941 length:837 start_codon:yes stop_codon:yes gene_type:complete
MANSRAHKTTHDAKLTKSKSIDRSKNIVRNDSEPILEVNLYDIDESIKYYIDNIITPSIEDHNGVKIQLPVIYGNPERWKSVQKANFFRDVKGKIQLPLFMYKKTGIEKIRDLGNKVDVNSPIYQTIAMKYSTKNRYDNFSRLQGVKPIREFHKVVVPDYVRVTYECIIWTEFISQMNSIVEAINYAEGSYWGRKEKFNFKSKIDSFSPATEISKGKDRATKTTFTLTLDGFIIPSTMQKALTESSTKTMTVKKLVIGSETVVKDINNLPFTQGEPTE